MPPKPLLLLDTQNLAWRALHSLGELSHEGAATGAIFGIFRDVRFLQKEHNTDRVAFCFDTGPSLRSQEYQSYKNKRQTAYKEAIAEFSKDKDARRARIAEQPHNHADGAASTGDVKRDKKATLVPETQPEPEKKPKKSQYDNLTDMEKEAYSELRTQINLLRTKHLPELGYRNVFAAEGYEADDVIASVCKHLPEGERAVIVSTDKDMYQLLSSQVTIWNPVRKCILTVAWLKQTYLCTPKQWIEVKAIAGCGTDEVEGIKGVGDKTAVKYLNGLLAPHLKTFQDIEANLDLIQRNRKLVKLPYPGTPIFEVREDELDPAKWTEFADSLGMKSLRHDPPSEKDKWRFGNRKPKPGLLDLGE